MRSKSRPRSESSSFRFITDSSRVSRFPVAAVASAARNWRMGLAKYQASSAAKIRLAKVLTASGMSGRGAGCGGCRNPGGGGGRCCSSVVSGWRGKSGGCIAFGGALCGGIVCPRTSSCCSKEKKRVAIPRMAVCCANQMKKKNFQNNRPTLHSSII